MRDLKSTFKRNEVLLPHIERHVLRKASQEVSDRRTDVLHPSEMAKRFWCERKGFYQVSGKTPDFKGRADSFRMSNVFDYGHSVHAKYQNWLAEMGVLWGRWKCSECDHTWFGSNAPLNDWWCDCERNTIVYAEVPLELPSLHIAGHCDGIVIGEVNRMIEIKTIGISTLRFEDYKLWNRYQAEQLTPDELWFNINRPFSTHLRQGQIYLHIAKTQYPELEIDEIVFIYEFKATQEVKEFVVKYNPKLIEEVLDKAASVTLAIGKGEPPERPSWAAINNKDCSTCEYRKTCWSDNDDRAEEGSTPDRPEIRVRRAKRSLRPRT